MAKILETHILYNHPHGDYVVSCATDNEDGTWSAYYAQIDELSLDAFIRVRDKGEQLTKHRAHELFGSCKIMEQQGRIKYI